jgi:nitrite reductase/ring-hydroxylating ferredoxin subunit
MTATANSMDAHRGDEFPPHPYSWYTVALERELKPGTLLTRPFLDGEIIVFRTESGAITAARPHCPHLGAHIGHGGRVAGETVVCPFHEFKFSATGECVEAANSDPPQGARLTTLPVRNHLGLIMVYHGPPEEEPAFYIDLPESDPDWHAFSTKTIRAATHPQDVCENAFDQAHFAAVHKFHDVVARSPMRIDGPRAYTEYAGTQPFPVFGGTPFHYRSVNIGLGFAMVEISVRGGWTMRQIVLPTPVARREVDLYVGVSVRRRTRTRFMRALLAPTERLYGWISLLVLARGIRQDKRMWDNKVYLEHPKLTSGDGAVGKYRHWARQFYKPTR